MNASAFRRIALLLLAAGAAHAQVPAQSPATVVVGHPGKRDTVSLSATQFASIKPGDTAWAPRQPVMVVPSVFFAGLHAKDSTIKALAELNQRLHDSLVRKLDTFGRANRRLDSIQDSAYRALSALQRRTDSLLAHSIRNTDQAVAIARSIRRGSYLASTVVGAVAGLAVRRSVWTGVGGALLGAGLNFLLVDF